MVSSVKKGHVLHLLLLQKKAPGVLWAVYKSGTGTSGRVCGDLGLGDARRGT